MGLAAAALWCQRSSHRWPAMSAMDSSPDSAPTLQIDEVKHRYRRRLCRLTFPLELLCGIRGDGSGRLHGGRCESAGAGAAGIAMIVGVDECGHYLWAASGGCS